MDYETLTFLPDGSFHVLDFGFDSYAAACTTNIDDPDHALIVAWMGLPDAGYPSDDENWQGALTLPRELTIRNRRLIQQPLSVLKQLRVFEIPFRSGGKLPRVSEMELISRGGDMTLKLFTKANGTGGLHIVYDDKKHEMTVDRSGLEKRFNTDQGEVRSRPLPKGLHHLRIYIDRSSVEIFVNDGDAVFTTRVFPTEEETNCSFDGDAAVHMWHLKEAVKDNFIV
jgi:beta-fructofuranosidase